MAMAEAASMMVVETVVTTTARSCRDWRRLDRRQLPPRATPHEPLLRLRGSAGPRTNPFFVFTLFRVHFSSDFTPSYESCLPLTPNSARAGVRMDV